MSRFMLNREQLLEYLKTHPHMADLDAKKERPENVLGDHKSVVLYAGIRTYCWRTSAECNAFIKNYGAKLRIRP